MLIHGEIFKNNVIKTNIFNSIYKIVFYKVKCSHSQTDVLSQTDATINELGL